MVKERFRSEDIFLLLIDAPRQQDEESGGPGRDKVVLSCQLCYVAWSTSGIPEPNSSAGSYASSDLQPGSNWHRTDQ